MREKERWGRQGEGKGGKGGKVEQSGRKEEAEWRHQGKEEDGWS